MKRISTKYLSLTAVLLVMLMATGCFSFLGKGTFKINVTVN